MGIGMAVASADMLVEVGISVLQVVFNAGPLYNCTLLDGESLLEVSFSIASLIGHGLCSLDLCFTCSLCLLVDVLCMLQGCIRGISAVSTRACLDNKRAVSQNTTVIPTFAVFFVTELLSMC